LSTTIAGALGFLDFFFFLSFFCSAAEHYPPAIVLFEMKRVAVVGSGVIGLTSAIRLLEAGWKVTVISDGTTPFTTSDGSAAIWFPFLAQPLDKVTAWSKISYEVLCKQVSLPNAVEMGLEMRSGYEFYSHSLEKDPDFASFVKDYRRVVRPELPEAYKDGIYCTVPVAAMTSVRGLRYVDRRRVVDADGERSTCVGS
jgi:D-amino-acid oxidase